MQTDPSVYIPHQRGMCLLDRVLNVDDQCSTCEVHIHESSLFFDDLTQSIPCWVGIEYMAQAVAAYAGYQSHRIRLGLLLSVRKYACERRAFLSGEKLVVKARKVFIEGDVGVFDCEIWLSDERIASAKLNTIQPDEAEVLRILETG